MRRKLTGYSACINLLILSNLDGNRLTYDTIINTGGIGVFRDASLVRDIRFYYANVDAVLSFEKALMDSRGRAHDRFCFV